MIGTTFLGWFGSSSVDRAIKFPASFSWRVAPFVALVGLTFASVSATASSNVPIAWGIDEDTGNLLSIEDYDSTMTVTDYGRLSINDGGVSRAFPDTDPEYGDVFADLESFVIDKQGFGYTVGNATVDFPGGGTFTGPHLYRIRIFNEDGSLAVSPDDAAGSGGYNVLQSLGPVSGISSGEINGLDIDPLTGDFWAVNENGGRDDLVMIDKYTGVATVIANSIDGTDDLEDLSFDENGNLYLIEDDGGANETDDILLMATLDRSGLIPSLLSLSIVNDIGGDVRIESLAWDFMNQRLLAFSDEHNSVWELNTSGDGYTDLGPIGFNDVEGLSFVPTDTGLPVPEPGSALLLGLGLMGLSGRLRRPAKTR